MEQETLQHYWKKSFENMKKGHMLLFALGICILQIFVRKMDEGVDPYISVCSWFCAYGAFVYGPFVGMVMSGVSYTLGAVIYSSSFFFPLALVEIASSFLFGVMLFRKDLSPGRTILAKLGTDLVCMNIMFPAITWFRYSLYENAGSYAVFQLSRFVGTIVFSTLEGLLIFFALQFSLPVFRKREYASKTQRRFHFTKKTTPFFVLYCVVAVALIVVYIAFLKGFIASHDILVY